MESSRIDTHVFRGLFWRLTDDFIYISASHKYRSLDFFFFSFGFSCFYFLLWHFPDKNIVRQNENSDSTKFGAIPLTYCNSGAIRSDSAQILAFLLISSQLPKMQQFCHIRVISLTFEQFDSNSTLILDYILNNIQYSN